MSISLITTIDCLALFLFLYTFFAFRDHRRRRGLPYPPGPPSLPLIGNLLDVPKLAPWLAYANMSKKYGDVVCLEVFGQVVVVLSSLTAIKDLVEKRGELYADRTPFPIFEMMDMAWMFPLTRKGKYWREGRRLLERSFRPGATKSHGCMIEENTPMFLGQLLATPKAFREHIEFLQGKLVMHLTYGYDLKENDDILMLTRRAGEIMKLLILPGAAVVNHLPFLRHLPSWVPWFKYEPVASECKHLGQRMKNEPMEFVRNSMRNGTAVPSLATEYLQEVDHLSGIERQQAAQTITDTLGSMFQAGTGSTISSMSSLFFALILFPEVQKRAQAELDSVISRERLPTYDDKPRLPYIEAISKELLRWHMVTPMGIPHAPTEDDFYKGYFIPKGAIVIANAWAILHDPELYPDPEAFKPERFLNDDRTKFRDDPTISLAFGAGRRICPARHFVDATLFLVTASVLAVFNVTRAKDQNGQEIPVVVPPPESIESDVAIYPPKFECSITPRDKLAEDLIRASALA